MLWKTAMLATFFASAIFLSSIASADAFNEPNRFSYEQSNLVAEMTPQQPVKTSVQSY